MARGKLCSVIAKRGYLKRLVKVIRRLNKHTEIVIYSGKRKTNPIRINSGV